jgi:hypothetical protein
MSLTLYFVDIRIIAAADVVLTFVPFMSLCKSLRFNWICLALKSHVLRLDTLDGAVMLCYEPVKRSMFVEGTANL